YREIRRELEASGVRFRSQSDTEVILEGYRRWGDGVIDRMRGMFAFALWDADKQRLLLARDRLGAKPLYCAQVGNSFIFGSEFKALLVWPDLNRAIDYGSLDQFLTFSYIFAPRTILAGVSKLPAAHKMVVERRADGAWSVGQSQCFWRLPTPNT